MRGGAGRPQFVENVVLAEGAVEIQLTGEEDMLVGDRAAAQFQGVFIEWCKAEAFNAAGFCQIQCDAECLQAGAPTCGRGLAWCDLVGLYRRDIQEGQRAILPIGMGDIADDVDRDAASRNRFGYVEDPFVTDYEDFGTPTNIITGKQLNRDFRPDTIRIAENYSDAWFHQVFCPFLRLKHSVDCVQCLDH